MLYIKDKGKEDGVSLPSPTEHVENQNNGVNNNNNNKTKTQN